MLVIASRSGSGSSSCRRSSLRDRDPFPFHDPSRNADHGAVRGHVLGDHGTGADLDAIAYSNVAQNDGPRSDGNVVADRRMALTLAGAHAPQCHPLENGHVIPDDGGLADYHPGGVIDEKALSDGRAGMYVRPGEEPAEVIDGPGEEEMPLQVLLVGYLLEQDRMQTGAEPKRLGEGTGGRVSFPERCTPSPSSS